MKKDYSDHPLVTIYTCVYNMADKIHRALDSMKAQTYNNIEHIIVDDGSTDDLTPIIEAYIESVTYKVLFIKKQNGGKHTATNVAFQKAQGMYLIQLDADDAFLPYTVERFVDIWNSIPDPSQYWCVSCAVRSQFSCKMFGNPFPDNINSLSGAERQQALSMGTGEKIGCMKTEIVSQYRFPEPEEVKFITESWLWCRIEKHWKTWYENDILRIYYINEGETLSNPKKTRQHFSNINWNYREQLCDLKSNIRILVYYSVTYFLTTFRYRNRYRYISCRMSLGTKIFLRFVQIPAIAFSLIEKKYYKLG